MQLEIVLLLNSAPCAHGPGSLLFSTSFTYVARIPNELDLQSYNRRGMTHIITLRVKYKQRCTPQIQQERIHSVSGLRGGKEQEENTSAGVYGKEGKKNKT